MLIAVPLAGAVPTAISINMAVQTEAALPQTISVQPAQSRSVQAEKVLLGPPNGPAPYRRGVGLRDIYCNGPGQGIPVQHAVMPQSVKVQLGERTLKEGEDYMLDHRWGVLALAPQSAIAPGTEVQVNYSYSMLRLDSLVRDKSGTTAVRQGVSDLANPAPPALASGETRLANVFVPYRSDGRNLRVWPITETPEQAKTLSAPGRLPKALAKLRAGEPLKIVCWGDSVTEGADVEKQEAYPAVLAAALKAKYPHAPVDLKVRSVSGSNSLNWLYPAANPFPVLERRAELNWEHIEREKPDVVTLEFVNDGFLSGAPFEKQYDEILRRVHALGAELVLITPHFTQYELADMAAMHQPDTRPYVLQLRQFAAKHNLAVADAAARWEHLWREGTPYPILLKNAYNHPDKRGHVLFVEELMKCFQ